MGKKKLVPEGDMIDLGKGRWAIGWPLDTGEHEPDAEPRPPRRPDPLRPDVGPPGKVRPRPEDEPWDLLDATDGAAASLPCGVLTTDNRLEVPDTAFARPPVGAVGLLRAQITGLGTVRGTAFLIRPEVALTATHVVYDFDTGTRASWASFERGARCSLAPTVTHKVAYAYFLMGGGGAIHRDIAVLCLKRLEAVTHPPTIDLTYSVKKERAFALGYPVEFGDRFCTTGPYRAQVGGRGWKVGSTAYWHYHDAVTTEGESGGPLLVRRPKPGGPNAFPAVGVLNLCSVTLGSGTYNRAANLTPRVIDEINLLADKCRGR